jgi:hypothetical protein
LAKHSFRFRGSVPPSIRLIVVTGVRGTSSRGLHAAGPSMPSRAARAPAADQVLENSSGATGWPWEPPYGVTFGVGRGVYPPLPITISGPSGGVALTVPSRVRSRSKRVTWLILPVVICLSQRLSHACLSISNLYRETANGSDGWAIRDQRGLPRNASKVRRSFRSLSTNLQPDRSPCSPVQRLY